MTPVSPPDVDPYDETPYESRAHYANHPDRMAVVATMLGLDPPPVSTCRVLELGCAEGGNVLPMAAGLPGARFVGIDLSARQIGLGREASAAIGLTNVDLLEASVCDLGEELGTFDYILAHGLFSWVPRAVQEDVLRVCGRCLAPGGVALVSYNTQPGWSFRTAVREMAAYGTRGLAGTGAKVARVRELVRFLAENVRDAAGGFQRHLMGESYMLELCGDAYIAHEHLELSNEPVYFHELVSRAGRHGLSYLGETRLRGMTLGARRPGLDTLLSRFANDTLGKEQLFDVLRHRQFRWSLLVKGDAPRALVPERLDGLLLRVRSLPAASNEEAGDAESWMFREDGRTSSGADPLVAAALEHLSAAAPRAVPFEEVLAAVGSSRERLREALIAAYLDDRVEFHVASPRVAASPGPCPMASPWARREAPRGGAVTTLWHETLDLTDVDRSVLTRLDGTRDVDTLLREEDSPAEREAFLTSLASLARSGLLVA